jgi:general secretion pathway protein N
MKLSRPSAALALPAAGSATGLKPRWSGFARNRVRSAGKRGQGMTSPWAWALAGALLGLLLAVLVNAPARWLTTLVQQGLGERLVFEDARGTVWSGSARLRLTGGAGSLDAATMPGRLTWLLRPSWGTLQADLNADCCLQQAWQWRLQPRWAGFKLTLADSHSQWPAQWLTGLGTPWNTLQVEGQLNLSTQALVIESAAGRTLLTGYAELDALHLSSRLSTLKPMGSYRVTLTGGATPTLGIATLEGALQLSGNGQWVANKLHFQGVASATPERLDALSNLLNIVGRRDGARSIIKIG